MGKGGYYLIFGPLLRHASYNGKEGVALMYQRDSGIKLSRYWPFWGLNFGIHIIIGLVAIMAGLVVIFSLGEIFKGFMLIGAGSFALLNGWQGLKELKESKGNKSYRTLQ